MNLSVIIPVYNTEKYIRQCLDSVLSQIDPGDEVILIDDGSTDGSAETEELYKNRYDCICLIRQKRKGQGSARNNGLGHASGEYVIFLDSDDYWKEDAVRKIKQCLSETAPDVLYFDSDVEYEDGITERNDQYDEDNYHRAGKITREICTGEAFFKNIYPRHFNVQPCMAAFRRAYLTGKGIRFPEGIFFEDNPFSLQAMLQAGSVRYLPERLYIRRYRAGSTMTAAAGWKNVSDSARVVRVVCNYIRENTIWYGDPAMTAGLYDFAYRLAEAFFRNCEKCRTENERIRQLRKEIYPFLLRFFSADNGLLSGEKYIMDYAGRLGLLFMRLEKEEFTEQEKREIVKHASGAGETAGESVRQYGRLYMERFRAKLGGVLEDGKVSKLGIYGTGCHTRELLKVIRRMRNCPQDIILIDSYVKSGRQEAGQLPVINIADVNRQAGAVILSSFLHEEELYRTAVRYLPSDIPVYRIYQYEMRPVSWELLNQGEFAGEERRNRDCDLGSNSGL